METPVSRASTIRLSLQPSPSSETSAFNKMRAVRSRRAGLLPLRIIASSFRRSSALGRTTYRFTEGVRAAITTIEDDRFEFRRKQNCVFTLYSRPIPTQARAFELPGVKPDRTE